MLQLAPDHPPYDAERLLWFLGLHAVPGIEAYDGATYARVLALPGGPGLVEVRPAPGGLRARVRVSDPADRAEAMVRVRALLDLGGDSRPAERALRRDPVLGPLVRRRPGLRMPGSVDHVETLVRTIVGQQISLAGARTVLGRVVAAYGSTLPLALAAGELGLTHSWPAPAALAVVDPLALPMPAARGRSVVAVARAVLEHGSALADGTPQRRPELLALPGVGRWTADYLAIRAAGDPDVALTTDLALRRAVERLGLPGDRASLTALAATWAPHRTPAMLQLWTDLLESRRP